MTYVPAFSLEILRKWPQHYFWEVKHWINIPSFSLFEFYERQTKKYLFRKYDVKNRKIRTKQCELELDIHIRLKQFEENFRNYIHINVLIFYIDVPPQKIFHSKLPTHPPYRFLLSHSNLEVTVYVWELYICNTDFFIRVIHFTVNILLSTVF